MKKLSICIATLLVTAALSECSRAGVESRSAKLTLKGSLVSRLPPMATTLESVETALLSPDGRRIGCKLGAGVEQAAMFDMTVGKSYSKVYGLGFSDDSARWAYCAEQGAQALLVVDGVEQPRYIGVWNPLFSPDGKHVAYVVQRGGLQAVVVDGRESKWYKNALLGERRFSPDSRRLAFSASPGEALTWRVVADGVEGPEYGGVFHLTFSPDSRRLAYTAHRGMQESTKWLAVIDGKESGEYDRISDVTFTADSRHFMYVAGRAGKSFVVVDGEEREAWDGTYHGELGRADGSVTYVGFRGPFRDALWFVVVGGRGGKGYANISHEKVSHDGKTIAFVAEKGRTAELVVLNGVEGRRHDQGIDGDIYLSPDGRRVAYWTNDEGANNEGAAQLWVDGTKSGRAFRSFRSMALPPVFFSADSKRIGFAFRSIGGEVQIVVDGVEYGPWDLVAKLSFTPDSKHWVGLATRGGHGVIVLDGTEYETEGLFLDWREESLVFSGPDRFHAMSFVPKGLKFVLVEATILPAKRPSPAKRPAAKSVRPSGQGTGRR